MVYSYTSGERVRNVDFHVPDSELMAHSMARTELALDAYLAELKSENKKEPVFRSHQPTGGRR